MRDQKPKQPKQQPQQKPIPEREIKQNAGVSATMALQAAQKAYEYKQAANAAGDPNAREEILAKAINKEIEAESFGKAAKYTQSGAFQGLAAGAGLGVQPGVTLGKVTGAIVGGTVATVTGLLGGGIGSVYGAMHGPMWNLGEMASHGVRGVVGDFPNWTSTPSQKKALEKMVMQSKETQAPSKEELEGMKSEMPDQMPESWGERVGDLTSWRPSLPEMPSMKKVGGAVGLGGLGASLGLGGKETPEGGSGQAKRAAETGKSQPSKAQRTSARQQQAKTSHKVSESKEPASKPAAPPKQAQGTNKSAPSTHTKSFEPPATAKLSASTTTERRKPRKLNQKPSSATASSGSGQRRAPRKLEMRKTSTAV